ncbi:MAG: glycosyltransferase [Planctomycetota bacterium]
MRRVDNKPGLDPAREADGAGEPVAVTRSRTAGERRSHAGPERRSPRRPTTPEPVRSSESDGTDHAETDLTADVLDDISGDALLFEAAWEVCNQVGGIYQVIRSKAPAMVDTWGDRYTLVGPWEPGTAELEFSPTEPEPWMGEAIDELERLGIRVHHGRWLITGQPRVLLIEHWRGYEHLDTVKYRLWDHHRIGSPTGDPLVDGVLTFADALRELMVRVAAKVSPESSGGSGSGPGGGAGGRRVLLHAHEWMGGLAIPMLRHDAAPVGTVFTTHATILGRFMASNMPDFYDRLPWVDPDLEAERFLVSTQHGIERACARSAHVFATVSPITGEECLKLLGRSPEVVTPNGLNMSRYDVGHEFQTLHASYKAEIHQFTMGHFFPSYRFDLDKTIYMFSSGRFEPTNKGFDLCLEAMARLNTELKAERARGGTDVTVVFFLVSKRQTRSLHPHALERRGVLSELTDVCERISRSIEEALIPKAAAGEPLSFKDLIDDYWALRYRRTQAAFRSNDLPMVTTHMLDDSDSDPILKQVRYLGLFNGPDDPVKIVYHPDFINAANPLWGIDYDQFVRGCHLGVFPSGYEPWGYTPLECIAMGVPAITSDLAGFGRYVAENLPDHNDWGLEIVPRRGRTFGEAAADTSRRLLEFCKLERRGRISIRNRVEDRSAAFDWSKLVHAYDESHTLALKRLRLDLLRDAKAR